MIIQAALAATAIVLGHGAGPLLSRQTWSHRYPAAAGILWLAAVTGAVTAAAGFVVLLDFGSPGPGHWLVERIHHCTKDHDHSGTILAISLSMLAVGVAARAICTATAHMRRTRSARHRHHEMLQLVVTDGEPDDVGVLHHPAPIAYCLPGSPRPIVLTSGALDQLNPAQLAAVLEHERAHLRGRHHLILALVDATCAMAPWAGTLRQARKIVPALLEQTADDIAADRHGPAAVAAALRTLTITPTPEGTLAAAPRGAEDRQRRLARLETSKPGPHGRIIAWTGAALTSALPLAIIATCATTVSLTC